MSAEYVCCLPGASSSHLVSIHLSLTVAVMQHSPLEVGISGKGFTSSTDF